MTIGDRMQEEVPMRSNRLLRLTTAAVVALFVAAMLTPAAAAMVVTGVLSIRSATIVVGFWSLAAAGIAAGRR
jgi:hypothetical protein